MARGALAPFRTPIVLAMIAVSTIAHTTPLFAISLAKWLLPIAAFRAACASLLVRIAESWIGFNSWLIDRFTPTGFVLTGLDGLARDGHYLVLANHRSWVDILVMQKVFNRRIPFLRFFLKRELIWVPLLGVAWWALDFPFMHRASRKQLARRPELAARDIEATRRACDKFKGLPVGIMNFVEGTRFTPEKHSRQRSPFARLLRPKAGGVAFVLDAMGSALHSVVDVTILYPGGTPTLMDLIAGRIPQVVLDVRERGIPAELLQSHYESDAASRVRFQRWVNSIWMEKDELLARLDPASQSSTPPESPEIR